MGMRDAPLSVISHSLKRSSSREGLDAVAEARASAPSSPMGFLSSVRLRSLLEGDATATANAVAPSALMSHCDKLTSSRCCRL